MLSPSPLAGEGGTRREAVGGRGGSTTAPHPASLRSAFPLMTEGFGRDGWQVLNDLRRGGTHIAQIAATPMSQMLDAKRRELWAAMKQPERPEHPPARYLLSKLNYSLEPLEYEQGGEEGRARKAEYGRRHEEDAAKQAEWEARSTERK